MPIRKVLTILLFPFFLLLLICCVVFYSSGTRQYAELVKKKCKSSGGAMPKFVESGLDRNTRSCERNCEPEGVYTMENNIDEGKSPIEPLDYLQMTSNFNSFLQHYSAYIDTVGLYLSDNSIYYIHSNTGSERDIMRNLNYEKLKKNESDWMWVIVSDVLPDHISKDIPYNLALVYPLGSEESLTHGCLWIGIRDDIYLNTIAGSKVTISSEMNLFQEKEMCAPENNENPKIKQ